MKGPVYWHPWLYEQAMRRLYGARGFDERYEVVASQVPPGADVVDLCAGDGRLRQYLPATTRYTAVDVNADFLQRLSAQGVSTVVANLRETVPTGTCVVMMAALYHFAPDHALMVRRALAAASKRFILTEPVTNVTNSGPALLARFSAWVSDPGDGTGDKRLTKEDLEQLMVDVPGGTVTHRAREWVMVWDR